MKEKYTTPNIRTLYMRREDIITTSNTNETEFVPFNPNETPFVPLGMNEKDDISSIV